jgi:hypothetical protein
MIIVGGNGDCSKEAPPSEPVHPGEDGRVTRQ